MEIPQETAPDIAQKHVYSVWAVPPEDVVERLKKLMNGLRSEFGGPQFEPHVTVVGAISLTEQDALDKFRSACDGVKAFTATVDRVVGASNHSTDQFGYKSSTPYMPHLSLLYGDLTDDEKKKAQEMANILDESIHGLSFQISSLALWKTDTEDSTLKSWVKIAECTLNPN